MRGLLGMNLDELITSLDLKVLPPSVAEVYLLKADCETVRKDNKAGLEVPKVQANSVSFKNCEILKGSENSLSATMSHVTFGKPIQEHNETEDTATKNSEDRKNIASSSEQFGYRNHKSSHAGQENDILKSLTISVLPDSIESQTFFSKAGSVNDCNVDLHSGPCKPITLSATDELTNSMNKIKKVYMSGESLLEVKVELHHISTNKAHYGKEFSINGSIPRSDSEHTGLKEDLDLSNLKGPIDFGKSCNGRTFFLNSLEFMDVSSKDGPTLVSLPELVFPVESLSRIFIATFTSDIFWFLRTCRIPNTLPVTVACHDAQRCWSPQEDQRCLRPYPEYPHLVVVYPAFPDSIAFTGNTNRKGVACHHPKLLLLQSEDRIRVIVTSANLVAKQWYGVTNTVWWQDFPRTSSPDYSSLFTCPSGVSPKVKGMDFFPQLASFIATLLADVASESYWIDELMNYDFSKASGHLVASIPGVHRRPFPYPSKQMHVLSAVNQDSCLDYFGSVETSVVGLSYRFHASADKSGKQLKALAMIIQECRENTSGMMEVLLQRNTNIPADANAISVTVCHSGNCTDSDIIKQGSVLLGFLPRNVVKWVAPLCDAGFFSFSAFVFPQEVLASALGTIKTKVQLILFVSQGPNFSKISQLKKHEHVVAMSSLLASIQRCLGIWRLQEVLSTYRWPDSQEIDFIYGSSSIGSSLNSNFLAAFVAATGKRSTLYTDSEESDPEWGFWNASNESRNPSMQILFPTIDRVKNSACGIRPYRCLLCFSEKTWKRLEPSGMFVDAVPYPSERAGHPMHVKVARRRFRGKHENSSFGWVYFGSHNLSPAAWGLPLPDSSGKSAPSIGSSVLGSRLYICNYELGMLLIVPPPGSNQEMHQNKNLNDIMLPFAVPAPKYQNNDRPATMSAMRDAWAEYVELQRRKEVEMSSDVLSMADEYVIEDEGGDEILLDVVDSLPEENADEMVYAETLWSQVDSDEA